MRASVSVVFLLGWLLAGCGSSVQSELLPGSGQEDPADGFEGMTGDDSGGIDDPGTGGGDDDGYCGTNLTGTVRDFRQDHPDFEFKIEVDPGIVTDTLGGDGKPVYAGKQDNPTTNGAAAFDQWYRDVAGVNLSSPLAIQLFESSPGVYTYTNSSFFPVDGAGFGDEGHPHNYHFTYELRTKFVYNGGEVFKFTGDDDLFTYINGKLVIDLGGVHGAMDQEVDLDARADYLGIEPGGTYSLDVFFAERHTSESNFRIDTTIGSFVDCGGVPL